MSGGNNCAFSGRRSGDRKSAAAAGEAPARVERGVAANVTDTAVPLLIDARQRDVVQYKAMNSPFPGMDPYLEAHWLDVHPRLIVAASDQLQGQLGESLIARIEERLIVEDPASGDSRRIGPDVRVVEFGRTVEYGASESTAQRAGGIALTEPIVLTAESEPIVQRFLEIIDVSTGGRVVTVIEFVSPANKAPGDGLEKYRQKQSECRGAGVNLVEIDLTRSGHRQLLAHRWHEARRHDSTYQASVWRAAAAYRIELYPIRLAARLPAMGIPLRPSDADAVLDLQSLVDAVYARSRYDRTSNYRESPQPPLEAEEATWADSLLKAAGRR
jgi:hypothetical protein